MNDDLKELRDQWEWKEEERPNHLRFAVSFFVVTIIFFMLVGIGIARMLPAR